MELKDYSTEELRAELKRRNDLAKAEKLKVNLLNTYIKYLGNSYGSLTVKKVQVIINQLRIKLYNCMNTSGAKKIFPINKIRAITKGIIISDLSSLES